MSKVTLNDFFGVSVNGFWNDVRPELLSALKGSGLTQLTATQWPSVISGVMDKAKELFDIDIASVIVTTWSKYRELTKYTDPKKHPSGECNLVPLAKHTLTVTYHPYFEVLFNGAPVGKIVFDTTLSLELEGFVLTIQDGRIMKVHTGSCQGKGKIAFKDYTLLEKSLTKITLPGIFDLGEGMSLGRSDNTQKQEMEISPLSASATLEPESKDRFVPDDAAEKHFSPTAKKDCDGRTSQLAEAYLQGML